MGSGVLGGSFDSLMGMDYPAGAWRLYIVDDASTDHVPDVMRQRWRSIRARRSILRREKGGQGKAHTLNHRIREILAENWVEAVMIMDADVLFEPLTLRRMTRHLADSKVGGVTVDWMRGYRSAETARPRPMVKSSSWMAKRPRARITLPRGIKIST
jgi:cellulose synthase/poly-beta-1,6-N-acetylglucosamine synthase-like glycosyltransferase